MASLVQSLCGRLLQSLVRKPCVDPKRPLFFSVALQKNKMGGLEKVPCAVPCAGLRRPCAGFFGLMDHSGAHVARSGATPKTGIRHIHVYIYIYIYNYIHMQIQCILRNK